MLVSSPKGDIRFADPAACRWMKDFFGRPLRAGILPRKLCRWISEPNRDGTSLVRKNSKAQLYLKREPSYTDDNLVILFELIKKKRAEDRRRHRNLTRREREVLFWLTYAKPNGEIAAILGIAPSTVGKHLERIYSKLGVENRTAATNVSFGRC